MIEPTRICARCLERKPWSMFWAAAKWPDGTMRRPQYRCKECVKAARRERRKTDPEWAHATYQRDWQRIKADPQQLAKRRALTRENATAWRRRHAP